MVHKKELWKEIRKVISDVDANACRTRVSKKTRMQGELKFSPIEMNRLFSRHLQEAQWHESRVSYWVTHSEKLIRATMALPPDEQKSRIEAAGEQPIFSYNQTDFVKDRVALEVQFGKYAFVAYDLFVKHPAFYVRDEINVGIEIIPMKSLQAEMSSGPGYFEGELYNVIRNGRGVPSVPLVMIDVEP
ncbi:MAG: hypothetical protein LBK55_12075 [Azoarcus sp.]|jgi:hypothetical protein|nr:hypothetical protein [Azoarcus sp.]